MYEDDSGSSMQELESRPKRMLVAIAECSMSDLSNFISFGLPVEPGSVGGYIFRVRIFPASHEAVDIVMYFRWDIILAIPVQVSPNCH